MLGEIKSWADIPETFLLKEYHMYIPIKRRSVFSQLKKWKTKLCFPSFRNDACSRLMVHLFTNRFCAHSSKMPINHVESAMKCFTAAVHNPQIQRNKWGISIFWGYLSSWRGTEDGTEASGREEVLSCCFFGIVQKFAENIYFLWMDSFQCLHCWSSLLLLWLALEL